MAEENISHGERRLGSWHVYIGEEGPTTAKITGKLIVTERHICFESGIALAKNAGTDISNRIQAFQKTDTSVEIPFTEIASVSITRKYYFLKTLNIVLKSGGELALRFGAMSPKSAHDLISQRLAGSGR